MSLYFVITGWIIYYAIQLALGNLSGLSSEEIGVFFHHLTQSEHVSAIFHSLSAFITFIVVAAGLKNGVEKFVRYLMPLLFILILSFCEFDQRLQHTAFLFHTLLVIGLLSAGMKVWLYHCILSGSIPVVIRESSGLLWKFSFWKKI